MANGRLLVMPKQTRSGWWWTWGIYVRLAVDAAILSWLGFFSLISFPSEQQTARELRQELRADFERHKELEQVRKHQVMLEAQLVLQQERNLELAKQLQKLLEGKK